MKIALLGYGKMGKEVEKIALAAGHEIVLRVNAENAADLHSEKLKEADVAIEFSTPDTVIENIKRCADIAVPIVVGTTAWYKSFEEIKSYVVAKNASLFYASNFSIGVNLFFKLNEMAAKIMEGYGYSISMDEVHHTQKLDAPSGTAITTAEHIFAGQSVKKTWTNTIVTEEDLPREENSTSSELLIRSIRKDAVPGTHITYYDSAVDTIELAHIAHSRAGFAKGAVHAAEWIKDKKGIYSMSDMLTL